MTSDWLNEEKLHATRTFYDVVSQNTKFLYLEF